MLALKFVLYASLSIKNQKIHRQVSTVGMSLEELYEVEPIPPRKGTLALQLFSILKANGLLYCHAQPEEKPIEQPTAPASDHSLSISCCRCARQVHASRYTAHLEKCMSGSRRQVSGAERHALAVQNERRQLEALGRPPLPSSRFSY